MLWTCQFCCLAASCKLQSCGSFRPVPDSPWVLSTGEVCPPCCPRHRLSSDSLAKEILLLYSKGKWTPTVGQDASYHTARLHLWARYLQTGFSQFSYVHHVWAGQAQECSLESRLMLWASWTNYQIHSKEVFLCVRSMFSTWWLCVRTVPLNNYKTI